MVSIGTINNGIVYIIGTSCVWGKMYPTKKGEILKRTEKTIVNGLKLFSRIPLFAATTINKIKNDKLIQKIYLVKYLVINIGTSK